MSKIDCGSYSVLINEDWEKFTDFLKAKSYSELAILVDENTEKYCLPNLLENLPNVEFDVIKINSGEIHKTIQTCEKIWEQMIHQGMDRHSCLINLGGGVIGDMGGFCARTFMRGIDFIQIPTTLLSQVDASVGGKLGVDFQDLKNIIGVIQDPQMVWIHTEFLNTLAFREIRSGYAEIIKHSLIMDAEMWERIKDITALEGVKWEPIISHSVRLKRDVVVKDKYEGGLRKILNFGHTLGHAIETMNLHSAYPLLHGEAISIGMIMEAYLSKELLGLSDEEFISIKKYILHIYPHFVNNVMDHEAVLKNLTKDKKNRQGKINFSLLKGIGTSKFDVTPTIEQIKESIEAYIV